MLLKTAITLMTIYLNSPKILAISEIQQDHSIPQSTFGTDFVTNSTSTSRYEAEGSGEGVESDSTIPTNTSSDLLIPTPATESVSSENSTITESNQAEDHNFTQQLSPTTNQPSPIAVPVDSETTSSALWTQLSTNPTQTYLETSTETLYTSPAPDWISSSSTSVQISRATFSPAVASVTAREPASMSSLCYDAYQHCLLSQTARFGVDPIGPYFIDETSLAEFCKQHDEIVQPCLGKALHIDQLDSALERCATAVEREERVQSTIAYMIIRAWRAWQFMCHLHQLHVRNESTCFHEKFNQCVLNMDLNFLVKCQAPCEKVEAEFGVTSVSANSGQSLFDTTSDFVDSIDSSSIKSSTGDQVAFFPQGGSDRADGRKETTKADSEESNNVQWLNGSNASRSSGKLATVIIFVYISVLVSQL